MFRQLFIESNNRIPLDIEYSFDYVPASSAEYLLSYSYMSKEDADKIKTAISGVYNIIFDGANNKLTWLQPSIPITRSWLYLLNETSSDKVSNEWEMINSNKSKAVEGNDYSLVGNKLAYGKYRVNVLIESNDKLRYANSIL